MIKVVRDRSLVTCINFGWMAFTGCRRKTTPARPRVGPSVWLERCIEIVLRKNRWNDRVSHGRSHRRFRLVDWGMRRRYEKFNGTYRIGMVATQLIQLLVA